MVALSESLLLNCFVAIATVFVVFLAYFKWTFKYWERKGVQYIQPVIPFGNLGNVVNRKEHLGVTVKAWYDEFRKSSLRIGGAYSFWTPFLIVMDPELIKNIVAKDFQYFTDRGLYYNERDDPLSAHLVALQGQRWKNLRTKLTPTFTSGKMKMMFQAVVDYSQQLKSVLDKFSRIDEPLDAKHFFACFTMDVIGACAFGIECNSFKGQDDLFVRYGQKVFQATPWKNFTNTFSFGSPNLARKLRITINHEEAAAFFYKLVKDTVEHREKNPSKREDFMQLLIGLKNQASANESLTFDEVAAQSFLFLLAGYETSATTGAFCLYELSKNQSVQEKLREEIRDVFKKHDGKLTYDAMFEMKYLEQVISETLRLYPPFPFLARVCTKDYAIPDMDVVIEKGSRIFIPSLGMHHDPKYFPEPENFSPDRFSDDNKHKIAPYTYLPFGEGPRNCIGMRFAMMQVKVGLAAMLKDYRFTLNNRTKTPVTMDPLSITLSVRDGTYLNVEKVA